MRRDRTIYWLVAGTIAIAARDAAAEPKPFQGFQSTILSEVKFEQRLDRALPLDSQFRDENGRAIGLQSCFTTKPVILALVYYRCPMLCNEVLNGLVKTLLALDFTAGRDFDVLVVSIDPRETPELALEKKRRVLRRFNGPQTVAGWHFLTGSEANIEALASAVGFGYRYDPKSQQYAHASGVIVLTPQGRTSRYFYGIDYAPRDVRLALVEAGNGAIGSPVDQVLLFCFHYDPATGRYGLAIWRLLQTAGATTVAALAGFIFLSLRRERRQRGLTAHGSANETGQTLRPA